MSELKRTKGPWIFEPHGGYGGHVDGIEFPLGYISLDYGRPMFELNDTPLVSLPYPEMVGNAIMMTAAPELLEACEGLVAWIEANSPALDDAIFQATNHGVTVQVEDVTEHLTKARAAIAAAKGGEW